MHRCARAAAVVVVLTLLTLLTAPNTAAADPLPDCTPDDATSTAFELLSPLPTSHDLHAATFFVAPDGAGHALVIAGSSGIIEQFETDTLAAEIRQVFEPFRNKIGLAGAANEISR